jgi:hypothetical protein
MLDSCRSYCVESFENSATMDALQVRGILGHNCDLLCAFCRCEAESCDHLFLSCPIVISVWTDLFLWMGVEAVTAVECVDHFLRFSSRLKGKSWRKWRHIFWLSTM